MSAEWQKPIRQGGLMRCCIETLADYHGADNEGTVLACNWCSDSMRVRDGAWEWNSPPVSLIPEEGK